MASPLRLSWSCYLYYRTQKHLPVRMQKQGLNGRWEVVRQIIRTVQRNRKKHATDTMTLSITSFFPSNLHQTTTIQTNIPELFLRCFVLELWSTFMIKSDTLCKDLHCLEISMKISMTGAERMYFKVQACLERFKSKISTMMKKRTIYLFVFDVRKANPLYGKKMFTLGNKFRN